MAEALHAHRQPALADAYFSTGHITLKPAKPASRVNLRADQEALAGLSSALGLPLPNAPKASTQKANRLALWLGPDEWLVIDEDEADLMTPLKASGEIHAATDVSHRNIGLLIEGRDAVATLNGACPLDLSLKTFPIGSAARTVFGKIEIVLYRGGENSFRLECWRSFADYAFGMLKHSAEDARF